MELPAPSAIRRTGWAAIAAAVVILLVFAAAVTTSSHAGRTMSGSFQSSYNVINSGLSCETINSRTTCKDSSGKVVRGVPLASIKGSPNCQAIVNDMAYACGPPGPPAPPVPPIEFPPCFPFCGTDYGQTDSSADGD